MTHPSPHFTPWGMNPIEKKTIKLNASEVKSFIKNILKAN